MCSHLFEVTGVTCDLVTNLRISRKRRVVLPTGVTGTLSRDELRPQTGNHVCTNWLVSTYECQHNRAKGRETVRVQTAWATKAGRSDAGDQFWDEEAVTTENPHLQDFKENLEKEEYEVSAEGRCEKCLSLLLQKKTWSGSGSYTSHSWHWYVSNMLPRFAKATEAWSATSEDIMITTYVGRVRLRRSGRRGFHK